MLSNSHHHNRFHMKSSRHSIELANADITRLMDPSYHPTNYGASSTEPARAYIDRRGQMHDPDFHYFPVYEGAGKNNNRRARRISDPVARSRIQFEDEDVDLAEYEEEEVESRSRQYNRRHNTRRPRSSQSHTYSISSSDSYYPSSSASSPSTTSSPLPYSSVFEDKPRHHHSLLTRKFRRQSSDSTPPSSPLSYSSPLDFDDYSDVEDVQQSQPSADDVDEEEHQEVSAQQPQTTFSYSHAMRKQWLALSLSMRFGLLRARRRASSSCRSNRR
ncbi:hypothetical protein GGU11DRAFT_799408 [Lentinula aff. detonsa]|nr:hypothetical protein GGU11DRAFT_799408 [Lentinula aff. detonsa]